LEFLTKAQFKDEIKQIWEKEEIKKQRSGDMP
jgi:hypothetical protein